MISKSKSNERAEFISESVDADTINRQFIEAPLAAARQPAITTGLDLLAFMTTLPDAFIASEKRELKRLARSGSDKNDPRIERLEISIERAGELRSSTHLGKARLERGLVSLSEDGNVFHGFVSGIDLQPREKITVRISAAREGEKSDKALSAMTDSDGYFSIPLGKDTKKATSPESAVNLSGRMNELLMRVNAKAGSSSNAATGEKSYTHVDDGKDVLARVEILDAAGNILHRDASPLVVNAGTAYREYVIDGNETVKPFEPVKPAKPAEAKTAEAKPVDAKTAATLPKAVPAKTAAAKKASIAKKKK